MRIDSGFTKSKYVVGNCPRFLGVHAGSIATVYGTNYKVWQIRIGLIWWHYVITWNRDAPAEKET